MHSKVAPALPNESAEVRQSSPQSTVRATGQDEGFKNGFPRDLQSIVDAWIRLPEAVGTGMVAMAKAALEAGI
jgi:hypothetical protein